MNKFEFSTQLRDNLSCLPNEDIEKYVDYYSEFIDDRVEDGLTEEEAVAALGSVNDIATQILADFTASKSNLKGNEAQNPNKKHEVNPWIILLIVLGAPIWLSVLAGVISAVAGVIIAVGSVFVSLYATSIAFLGASVGCFAGVILLEGTAESLLALGVALMLAGGGTLLLIGTNWLLKQTIKLIKWAYLKIKPLFKRRGKA